MATIPRNAIAVYSFSKYFGATGWRLGVIAVSQDNVFDRKLARASRARQGAPGRPLRHALASTPRAFASSTAWSPTAARSRSTTRPGLSLPQQVQMTLFATFALLDRDDQSYKLATRAIIGPRLANLYEGMGIAARRSIRCGPATTPRSTCRSGPAHATAQTSRSGSAASYEPVDPLFRLARRRASCCYPARDFDGPAWSVRVSLANLDDDAYFTIGQQLVAIFDEYVAEWRAATAGPHETVSGRDQIETRARALLFRGGAVGSRCESRRRCRSAPKSASSCRSPAASAVGGISVGVPTKVPFVEPRSSTYQRSWSSVSLAWRCDVAESPEQSISGCPRRLRPTPDRSPRFRASGTTVGAPPVGQMPAASWAAKKSGSIQISATQSTSGQRAPGAESRRRWRLAEAGGGCGSWPVVKS